MSAQNAITIRQFTLADIEAVWNLRLRALREHPEAFGEPYEAAVALGSDDVHERASSMWTSGDNRVFIATNSEGEPLGMLGVYRQLRPRERHRMGIWGVYVAPEHRGRRISSRLMDTALAYARSLEGVLQVEITVHSLNHVARHAYERHGFGAWGTMPRAELLGGTPLDAEHMALMLDAPALPGQPEGTP